MSVRRFARRPACLAVASVLFAPAAALATNGMNLEGYGPIAAGMGGAGFAYDNGAAAVMNNPATLGLMRDGTNRLDVALAELKPNVDAEYGPASWSSEADSFLMPAFGFVRRSGGFSYGIGVFSQGGMGTEYQPGPGASMSAMGMMMGGAGQQATGTVAGWQERSEVGVGRAILPLVYTVNDNLTVGGSLDYVWASMDIQMAMPGQMMQDMMPGGSQSAGVISGSMVQGLMQQMQAGRITGLWGGYFDFSDDSDFSGAATADGFAGKLGVTWRVNQNLSFGATYHSETDLGDLSGDADVAMAVETPMGTAVMPVSGKIKIRDFQWPETYGIGVAWQDERMMFAADIKQINWGDVMKDFNMSFTADSGDFAGSTMDATLYQDWKDQTVLMLGGAYKVTPAFTLRAGANLSENPIPDRTVNYLFPAIIENHFTAGFGYEFSPSSAVNFALSYAPEAEATTPQGLKITHEQMSWQLMYSHMF